MKVIFSRKGVDSSSGGFASPLFVDGSMHSVPIPDARSPVTYGEVAADFDLGKLISNLSSGKINRKTRVHLDPDLDSRSLPRNDQWTPLFGQCGAAQSHLDKFAVSEGDLFIFFGWFRQVEFVRRKWRYVVGSPDIHVIFGWLQVGCIHRLADLNQADPGSSRWLTYHPHCHGDFSGNNTIYQASKALGLPGLNHVDGAGVFSRYAPHRQLTTSGRSRSIWTLPKWMYPKDPCSALSYHTDLSRWKKSKQSTELRAVSRGQEFVLDLKHYPDSYDWLEGIWAD